MCGHKAVDTNDFCHSGARLESRGFFRDRVAPIPGRDLLASSGDRVLGQGGETRSALQAGRLRLALVEGAQTTS